MSDKELLSDAEVDMLLADAEFYDEYVHMLRCQMSKNEFRKRFMEVADRVLPRILNGVNVPIEQREHKKHNRRLAVEATKEGK